MSNQKPVLYSYWRSSCSWRVRIALALKNVDYEYKTVDLLSEEAKSKLKEINPAAKVPTFVVDGQVITESLAIIEYLEETHPDVPLLPKDPIKRAHARAISLLVASGIQPLHNLKVLQLLNKKEAGFGGQFAKQFVVEGLTALEILLKQHSGKYAVGDDVTIADLSIPPLIYSANRFNLDLSPYPTVNRINETLADIPAFIAAHPDNQPDTGLNA
ncbi:putative maleylacetoacetate isomerase [Caenorhabditis elegans]|uniref:Probable maleylacetoacetate isomerase n=1 Tax=Caenorhabditis elegans TaxID=6239 RepID=MAAI_CAEEL|nr:putative maleylacetoacetate isomerase [Caenorhabditis elegans]Q18938.1 RecName: Full=Probable maleylacetoacetate isomerase; Short=MAAI; AltName: Full=Glutathione S-transferase gst-42 [Caenorhabditis elegans]CAA91449.1 Probable maleylacetoacetate isomerase [Caenorhabditis elegans]|eukprot:NP_509962.1 Probable maleylacetoacetate isomerase [Caenorhabditis elegans]